MPQKPYLASGELARMAEVSTDTLRHYERMNLLPRPRRSAGNYRLYPPEMLDRVRLIRRALAVGFSLPELAAILKIRDQGGVPCRQVKRLLEEKLTQVEAQISDLVAMRDQLRGVVQEWGERLKRTPEGTQARLLEALELPARKERSDKKNRIDRLPRGRRAVLPGA
jgi:DNA-binding transcriptional MerR regulator